VANTAEHKQANGELTAPLSVRMFTIQNETRRGFCISRKDKTHIVQAAYHTLYYTLFGREGFF